MILSLLSREIWEKYKASSKGKIDIHTKLMRQYEEIPGWWFHGALALSLGLSLVMCIFMNDAVQLPWWALLLSAGLGLFFTLPISIITATTNTVKKIHIRWSSDNILDCPLFSSFCLASLSPVSFSLIPLHFAGRHQG